MSDTGIPRSRSVIIVGAVFFGLGTLLGGAALADVLDPKLLGLLTLVFVSVRGAWDYFVNASQNVDAGRVAIANVGGVAVAGAGSHEDIPTGMPVNRDLAVAQVLPPPAKEESSGTGILT